MNSNHVEIETTQNELTRTDWLPVVRQRLDSLADALARLKESPRDPESLHDVRVACRRSDAVLIVCRDLLRKRRVDRLRDELSRLRRSCNSARDNDVLRKWLKDKNGFLAKRLRKKLAEDRRIDQSRIVEVVGSLLRKQRLARQAERVCDVAENSDEANDERPLLARGLLNELKQFVQAFPTKVSNARQLHHLRIATKRLRYACEFVSEVMPAEQFETLLQLVRQVQERLGELHDLDVREQCLKRVATRAEGRSLQCSTKNERDRLLKAWQAWWATSSPEASLVSADSELLRLVCHCSPATDVSRNVSQVVPSTDSRGPSRSWEDSPS